MKRSVLWRISRLSEGVLAPQNIESGWPGCGAVWGNIYDSTSHVGLVRVAEARHTGPAGRICATYG
eukprot:scaffold138722_cov20-Prasinocladus_malaysianus.AAC.2